MASFQIPNLPTLCGPSFTLRANKHCRVAGETALAWTKKHGFLDAEEFAALPGAQVPLLASLCYATCDIAQLVLLVEFMTLLTHWWDRGWDERSEEAWDDVYKRVRRTTSEAWQTRFQETLQAFRVARTDEGSKQAVLADVDAYIAWRKQSSGVALGIALIEYAEGLNIPETTRSAESFQQLSDSATEIVIWMHDIASYNIQQAADDRHNAVAIIMSEKKVPLQTAVNVAGEKVKSLVEKFLALEKVVLGSADREVRAYVAGLRDWIVGTAHWVYRTDRYFKGKGDNVKTFGWVFLLPKEGEA